MINGVDYGAMDSLGAPNSQDSAPQAPPVAAEGAENAQQAPQLTDISKLEKFLVDGQEKTWSDLKKEMMLHKDYTKKTQEYSKFKKEFDESKTYQEHLRADWNKVVQNPQLVSEFKRVYPEQFHHLVEHLEKNGSQAQPTGQQSADQATVQRLQQLEDKLSNYDKRFSSIDQEKHEVEVKAAEQQLDNWIATSKSKYSMKDSEVEVATARAQIYMNNGGELNEQSWDKICKKVHDQFNKDYAGEYQKKVNEQINASQRGKDVPSGGGLAGQAPKSMKLKDVQDHMIASLGGK